MAWKIVNLVENDVYLEDGQKVPGIRTKYAGKAREENWIRKRIGGDG